MHRSNCLLFAFAAWWRWRKRGAYWALRRSRHIWGLHWLVYHPRYRRWVHYEPLVPKGMPVAALDKIFYHGTIKRDDDADK